MDFTPGDDLVMVLDTVVSVPTNSYNPIVYNDGILLIPSLINSSIFTSYYVKKDGAVTPIVASGLTPTIPGYTTGGTYLTQVIFLQDGTAVGAVVGTKSHSPNPPNLDMLIGMSIDGAFVQSGGDLTTNNLNTNSLCFGRDDAFNVVTVTDPGPLDVVYVTKYDGSINAPYTVTNGKLIIQGADKWIETGNQNIIDPATFDVTDTLNFSFDGFYASSFMGTFSGLTSLCVTDQILPYFLNFDTLTSRKIVAEDAGPFDYVVLYDESWGLILADDGIKLIVGDEAPVFLRAVYPTNIPVLPAGCIPLCEDMT